MMSKIDGFKRASLEACTHPGQRRAEVMRDVVANPGDCVDQNLDPVEHAVRHAAKFVERWSRPWVGRRCRRSPATWILYSSTRTFARRRPHSTRPTQSSNA
jgi:hypothetical protein